MPAYQIRSCWGREIASDQTLEAQQEAKYQPPTKLFRRRRSLSEPRNPSMFSTLSNIARRSTSREQRQSGPIFALLPPELRNMIFSLVFGSDEDLIHIVQLWRKMLRRNHYCHIHLPYPAVETHFLRHCFWSGQTSRSLHPGLRLLMTCRQAYRECIPLLYASNTFDFDDPAIVLSFARSILPQRLAAITSIQLTYYIRSSLYYRGRVGLEDDGSEGDLRTCWDPMWSLIVKRLPNLKKLKIVVDGSQMDEQQLQDLFFGEITGLRGLQEMVIHVRTRGMTWAVLSPLARDVLDQSTLPRALSPV
ncbi:hypothetical protein BDV95DRAFT_591125 [Massariosphaeria phaeospora]|uniref:DUF7730 domain-containing protein n=1 Tax=Massariosphaeria phaeospora TaxID=100035 RepID=A0A7C8IBX9_9PLEO|nr:hypothetical protein BDV95DRAFT_591125 [Massariosphaeria phaeospora]